LKIVVISDTHGKHRLVKLPKGDVLIHAGDVSYRGERYEVEDFLKWFSNQPHPHKIFIAGNHDFFFERTKPKAIESIMPVNVTYLNDSGIDINGCKIWGSPITPQFFQWAFNRKRGEAVRRHWELIPMDTNILITHGPPYRILDQTIYDQYVGCKDLLLRVQEVAPQYHLFGHIHEAYGNVIQNGTRFINASIVNESYDMVHRPVVFDWKQLAQPSV
jgi:Icc-related predicted phosphoesterase